MSKIKNGKNQILTIACMAGVIWLYAALGSVIVLLINTEHGHMPRLSPEGVAIYVIFGVLAGFTWFPRRHIVSNIIRAVHVGLIVYALATLFHLLYGDFLQEGTLDMRAGLVGVAISSLAFVAAACWSTFKESVVTFCDQVCEAAAEAFTE